MVTATSLGLLLLGNVEEGGGGRVQLQAAKLFVRVHQPVGVDILEVEGEAHVGRLPHLDGLLLGHLPRPAQTRSL